MYSTPFFVGIAMMLVEVAILFAAPNLLSRLAFVPLASERRIRLPKAEIEPTDDPGYRETAMAIPSASLPQISVGRIDLDDAVLVQSTGGESFALRRAYAFGRRRAYYLVRITMELEGREVVLRVKQAIVPLTLPLVILGIGFGGSERHPGGWDVAGMFAAVAVAVYAVQWMIVAGARDLAISQAFDVIEDDVRRTFPERPKKRRKKNEAVDDDRRAPQDEGG